MSGEWGGGGAGGGRGISYKASLECCIWNRVGVGMVVWGREYWERELTETTSPPPPPIPKKSTTGVRCIYHCGTSHKGFMDAIRKSALQANSGRKKKNLLHWRLEPVSVLRLFFPVRRSRDWSNLDPTSNVCDDDCWQVQSLMQHFSVSHSQTRWAAQFSVTFFSSLPSPWWLDGGFLQLPRGSVRPGAPFWHFSFPPAAPRAELTYHRPVECKMSLH